MRWVKVLEQGALSEGMRHVVKVGKLSVLLLQEKGEILAMDSICPHMRGPMQKGELTADGGIVCPWHRSVFDIRTGDVKQWCPWPPGVGKALGAISREKALPVFPVRLEDGSILIGLDESKTEGIGNSL
ncbi:MAG: Rieske (2Fe-2S) protein [Synechococcus sp.]